MRARSAGLNLLSMCAHHAVFDTIATAPFARVIQLTGSRRRRATQSVWNSDRAGAATCPPALTIGSGVVSSSWKVAERETSISVGSSAAAKALVAIAIALFGDSAVDISTGPGVFSARNRIRVACAGAATIATLPLPA